jgi:hypothetical protein
MLGNADAFIVSFRNGIHDYVWGAYFGGSMAEIGWDLSCVGNTRLYLVGYVGTMTDFPLCQGSLNAYGTPYYDQSTSYTSKCFISDLDLGPFISYVGVQETNNGFDFAVYPVPATNSISVSANFNEYADVTLEITDLTGRIVYSSAMTNSKIINTQIDVSNFAEGTYILRLQYGEETSCEKILIQR